MKPKVLIMSGYGINCEEETAHAFEKAGAIAEIVHINDLISGEKNMKDSQLKRWMSHLMKLTFLFHQTTL